MIVEAQVTINGSKAAIWAAITKIENASETISGIENIEVLEKPSALWRPTPTGTRLRPGRWPPCCRLPSGWRTTGVLSKIGGPAS
jgi:hypothetical protein